MLRFIWMFVVGLIVGAIALFFFPGAQGLGFIMTGLLGIAGSIVGGFLAQLFNKPPPGTPFHPAGIIMSVIGSLILIYVWIHFIH